MFSITDSMVSTARGKQRVHHADQNAAEVVEQARRPIDNAERDQQLVDHAVAAEQHDPREGAHQEAGPERQQHPEQRASPSSPCRTIEIEIGDRIARDHREQRGEQRDLQRDQEHVDIDRRREQLTILREAESAVLVDTQQQELADRIDQQRRRAAAPAARPSECWSTGLCATRPGQRQRRRSWLRCFLGRFIGDDDGIGRLPVERHELADLVMGRAGARRIGGDQRRHARRHARPCRAWSGCR